MGKMTTYEKIEKYLFTDNEEIKSKSRARNEVEMSPKEMEILMRARAAFVYWLERPELPDSEIVNYLMREFKLSKSPAYNDMFAIKKLLGNVENAKKEFNRYTVIQMCKKAYQLAETQDDAKAMVMAADKIGKYTKCDQNEMEEVPWDQIIPANFEPTSDISVLDESLKLKDIAETRRMLRKKYRGEEVEDAEVIDNGPDI